MVKADSQDVQSDLAQALQKSWVEYAGIRPACMKHLLVELDQSVRCQEQCYGFRVVCHPEW
jgi:hypothetical protein